MSEVIASCELQIASDTELSLMEFQALPTETEIYILPDGEVVVADLPFELAQMIADLQKLRQTEGDVGL